jgi:hypothetical protein
MQLSPNAASLDERTGPSSRGVPPLPALDTQDDSPVLDTHAAGDSVPPSSAPAPQTARSTAVPTPAARKPATRLGAPAIPSDALRASARPRPSAPPLAAPTSARPASEIVLGAPLLPERANDPYYYPGISDEPLLIMPPSAALGSRAREWLRQAPRWQLAALGGAFSLLLILVVRGLFAGPSGASVVVDVTPPAARVSLDGEPLNALNGLRKRAGLMPGEHVLAAEHSGFVGQRRVFTLEPNKCDRRIVLTLEREAPPPPLAAEAEPAAAPATLPSPETADEAITPLTPRELAKQRRLERYRARREAAAAAREARSSRLASAHAARAVKAAATPGLLKLNSIPWAEVYVDKRHVGHTPLMGLSLRPGKHVVRLENPSLGVSKTLRVKLTAGETVTQVVKL